MWARLLSAVALSAVLTACGSSAAAPAAAPTIPPGADAQTTLQVEIAQQLTGQGLKTTNIQCPADVNPVEATTTTCTGVSAGQTLNLSVTFVAADQIIVTVVP
jgi:hypothetical protein